MNQPTEENPYKSPQFTDKAPDQPPKNFPHNEKTIRSAIYSSLAQSLFFSILASLLSHGEFPLVWVVSLIASWIATALILLRYKFGRSHVLTHGDVAIIKFNIWPISVVVLLGEFLLRKIVFLHY